MKVSDMNVDEVQDIVISASDDTISGSICDEADLQVVRRSRIPKPRAAKGSEDLNIRLVEVMVQTPKHKRLLIIKSIHTNNDYYHI